MERIGSTVLMRELDTVAWGKLYRGFSVEKEKRTRVLARVYPFSVPGDMKFASHLAVNERIDVETVDGRSVYLEEYLPGLPLSAIIHRCVQEGFPLPREHALHVLERILAGFEEHRWALPHPHLAILSFDGEVKGSGVPMGKVLAKAQPESLFPSLSPQLMESRQFGPQDQVYAAGAFFFEMLTGRELPPAGTEEEIINAISSTPCMDDEPIPSDLQVMLIRSLAHNTGERHPGLKDMREELGKLIYDGTYAPTTFNVAFFMHTLCRAEINEEETACAKEDSVDLTPLFAPPPEEEPASVAAAGESAATPPTPSGRSPIPFMAAAGIAVVLIVAALILKPWQSTNAVEQPSASPPAAESPELKAKLAEAQKHIADMEEQRRKQEEELNKMRADEQSSTDPEIVRKLKEKEAEATRMREALERMKQQAALEKQPKQATSGTDGKPDSHSTGDANVVGSGKTTPPPDESEGPAPPEPAKPEDQGADDANPLTDTPTRPVGDEDTTPPPPVEKPHVPSVTKGQLLDISEVDQAPIPIKTKRAKYPPLAKRRRIQGRVILRVLVDEKGLPRDFEAIRYPGGKLGMDKAAIRAVKEWKFSPALKEGVPVKTWTVVTIPFTL